ncbi:MAG: bifunctional folylpolyglutamate synthase/dihydrofolate synthase [Erythrobacter sp.]
MLDFGRSGDPRVQAQLDRLAQLSVPDGRLGLETIRALMDRLGNPHRKLPPVFHVAGTNGKGSVCAFLRAMLEADGKRVHVTTSPHLVRYNERIRIAGELIGDEALAALLAEVLDASEDLKPSFFEVTIAAAFLAFSRTPADACVVEVGLGGRLDATNVLEPEALAACGIAALGIDHEKFLLAPEAGVPDNPMARIGFEKAGIAKESVPLVTLCEDYYDDLAYEAIAQAALRAGARLCDNGQWVYVDQGSAQILDHYDQDVRLVPSIPGQHQISNVALAATMLLIQDTVPVSVASLVAGAKRASWPARLQCLSAGPLVGSRKVWLDGGHNPNAGAMLGENFAGQHAHLIIGMLEAKDPAALIEPLSASLKSVTAVPVPGHEAHGAEAFAEASAAPDVPSALARLPDDGLPVLIAGSLYLAGEVLRLNNEVPD